MKIGANCGSADRRRSIRECGYDKRITLEAIFAEDYEGVLKAALPIMKMF